RCLQTLEGHTAAVRCLAVSEDGRLALSGGEDYYLRLWDVAEGRCLCSLREESAHGVTSVALARDGRLGVAAGEPTRVLRLDCPGARRAPPGLCRVMGSEAAARMQSEYERRLAAARQALAGGDAPAAGRHLRQARAQPGCQRRQEAVAEWMRLYPH